MDEEGKAEKCLGRKCLNEMLGSLVKVKIMKEIRKMMKRQVSSKANREYMESLPPAEDPFKESGAAILDLVHWPDQWSSSEAQASSTGQSSGLGNLP